MKKFSLLSICMLACLFFSCEQEEVVYSCDPSIDEIVKEDLDNIPQMTRSDIVSLELELTKAYYRAFSKEQKIAFWQEKIDETLALEWNQAEMEHIKLLKSFFEDKSEIFDVKSNGNTSLMDEFEVFMYKWTEYAENYLKWDKRLIGAIAAHGHKLKNKNGDLEIPVRIQSIKTRSESNCNCSTSADFCSVWYCEKTSCVGSNHGCGWVWVMECNGTCGGL